MMGLLFLINLFIIANANLEKNYTICQGCNNSNFILNLNTCECTCPEQGCGRNNQYFNIDLCQCVCTNGPYNPINNQNNTPMVEWCGYNKKWSENKCSCECTNTLVCDNGVWDQNTCSCISNVCTLTDQDCINQYNNLNYVVNSTSCSCVCKESYCDNGVWDQNTCSCISNVCTLTDQDCINQYNNLNYVVNPTSCSCVCGLTNDYCSNLIGSNWVTNLDTCSCSCGLNDSICKTHNKNLNPNTCECECDIDCHYPFYLNKRTCECFCDLQNVVPPPLGSLYIYNYETCQYECPESSLYPTSFSRIQNVSGMSFNTTYIFDSNSCMYNYNVNLYESPLCGFQNPPPPGSLYMFNYETCQYDCPESLYPILFSRIQNVSGTLFATTLKLNYNNCMYKCNIIKSNLTNSYTWGYNETNCIYECPITDEFCQMVNKNYIANISYSGLTCECVCGLDELHIPKYHSFDSNNCEYVCSLPPMNHFNIDTVNCKYYCTIDHSYCQNEICGTNKDCFAYVDKNNCKCEKSVNIV